MFPLYDIVSDICVDFLGTHMASLVLFFKTGCDRKSLVGFQCGNFDLFFWYALQ